ncbi:MAG: sigma-70 family RNA polymerase sigma factor [Actinomycetota bacterium]|nr:sigma-70 family RNA polymerase sigma factor [Actinomycetota bacterium]
MAALRDTTKDRLAAVEPVVRRVLASKVFDSHRLDDLVQETLARVASSRRDLEGETLVAYAIVSARNVWASDSARSARRGELQHRLADTRQPEQPDALALAGEEHDALRVALASLLEAERRALMAHEVEGVDTATIAEEDRSTPGAVAARLARSRAKLRVDYVVAYRRAQLPTDECRSVLVALSAGDRRRQASLGAADHVLTCPTCAQLAPTLVERRLPLAAVIPAAGLRAVGRHVRLRPVQTTATVGAAGAVAAAVVVLSQGEPPPPATACPGLVAADGRPVDAGALAGLPGTGVSGRGVSVQSVPANEGFWASCGQGRVWVRLVGAGESSATIAPGAGVNFGGVAVQHGAGFAANHGVAPAEGAAELDAQGVHLEVPYESLTR